MAGGAPDATPTPNGVNIPAVLDDLTYCQAGWHLVSLSLVGGASAFPTAQEMQAYFEAWNVNFTIDGVPQTMERTAIKKLLWPWPERNDHFGVTFDTYIPPGRSRSELTLFSTRLSIRRKRYSSSMT
jgi:hypothetical protein